MTKHIRARLKKSGIKAKVNLHVICGAKVIKVFTPSFDEDFTSQQIHDLCNIAKINLLTCTRGTPIDPLHESGLTYKKEWNFEFHG